MDKKFAKEREQILRISGSAVQKCMQCGKCSGACPSYNEMDLHPHQFVYMVRNGNIGPLLESDCFYKCLTCFTCSERCPRGVEPAKVIEAVRLLATRPQGKNHLKTDSIPSLLDEDMPQQALVSALRKYAK